MPVPKITAQEFADRIRTGINDRNGTYDTAYGPIPDIVINPMAAVLEDQNDTLRLVSLLMSLSNQTVFDDGDVDAFVFNENLVRSTGSTATGSVTFSRRSAPTINITVQRGFPIATSPDETTGNSITFVTSQAATLPLGAGSNLTTGRWELQVPVVALTTGPDGIVGPNRINRPLRPLVEFDSVTNPAATVGGRGAETNDELIRRYLLAIVGTQLGTPNGLEKYIRNTFPDVFDFLTVSGADPLLIRAGTDAGAVDGYVIGSQPTVFTENVTYLGVGQLMTISNPPLISVNSVDNFIAGTDYEAVFDTSGYAGSVRARDGIEFLPTATSSLPAVGTTVSVTYTYNALIQNIQTDSESDDAHVLGRDLLAKQGELVDIFLDSTLTVLPGFNPSTIQGFVQNAVLTFIGQPTVPGVGLGLGDDVQVSDLQGAVRQLSGVDNWVITRLSRSANGTGNVDVPIANNEYARIQVANLTITI